MHNTQWIDESTGWPDDRQILRTEDERRRRSATVRSASRRRLTATIGWPSSPSVREGLCPWIAFWACVFLSVPCTLKIQLMSNQVSNALTFHREQTSKQGAKSSAQSIRHTCRCRHIMEARWHQIGNTCLGCYYFSTRLNIVRFLET